MSTPTVQIVLLTLPAMFALAAAADTRAPVLTPAACESLPLVPPRRLPAAGLPSHGDAQAGPVAGVRRIVGPDTTEKAQRVKQVIAERRRGVAFLLGDRQAGQIVGDLWVPAVDPSAGSGSQPAADGCGDTLVAVGYDDARYSGAFEAMRDCGKVAYDESVVWVRYEDFDRLCACAVELVGGGGATSTPSPAAPAAD